MPNPNDYDNKGEWMSACYKHEDMKEDYPNSKKRQEVCNAMWEDNKGD